MSDAQSDPVPVASPTPSNAVRWLPLAVLLTLMIAAGVFWFGTATGRYWRKQHIVSRWAETHTTLAPVGIVAVYVIVTLLGLPVWWLQLMCGRLFGMAEGVLVCQAAATIGATLAAAIARYSSAGLIHPPATGRLAKLRSLQQTLGHNGLLVVMATRLLHGVPFGLSNYLFGLIGIPLASVAIGTAIGNIPAVIIVVALGRPHPMGGKVIWAVVALNVVLLGVMALRYLKPGWFRQLHAE